jgi:hypothetical protein
MKSIPIDQSGELAKALEQQDEHEAIGLTGKAGTVAWVVRVPESLKGSEADVVYFAEGPAGRVLVMVEAKQASPRQSDQNGQKPVFGAGRGTLTIVSEDDEHLKDFQEYMK